MLEDPHLHMAEQNSYLGLSDSKLHALNYWNVYPGSCHMAEVKESKCLGKEIIWGEPWHVAGLVSCLFSPDTSHSHHGRMTDGTALLCRMCSAPCSWAHSCLTPALPGGQLPLETSPRADAQRVQSSIFSAFPFRAVFPRLLGPHLEQRALFGLRLGVSARPWASHNRWHVDEAHPKVGEPRQGAEDRFAWIPALGESVALARVPLQQLCVGWKAISSLLFPFQERERKEWRVRSKYKQGHSSS